MAVKTSLSSKELASILASYKLGEYRTHQGFEKGSDQTNILLEATTGKYSFRYYEKRSEEYVLFEIDVLKYLAERFYLSPVPIPNKQGKFIGWFNNKPFVIFSFMQGVHSDEAHNYRKVAKEIGRLHKITIGYQPSYSSAREGYEPRSIIHNAIANASKINNKVEAKHRLGWLQEKLNSLDLPSNLPQGVVHGDTNPSNFLYHNKEVSAVLDFDQASYAYLIYDLANLIYWWSWPDKGELDINKTRDLVSSYEEARALRNCEKEHLFDMLITCICVDVGWFIHEDGFRNSQRKIQALESIGRKKFYDKVFV